MTYSVLSKKCMKCSLRNVCDHKKMEAIEEFADHIAQNNSLEKNKKQKSITIQISGYGRCEDECSSSNNINYMRNNSYIKSN